MVTRQEVLVGGWAALTAALAGGADAADAPLRGRIVRALPSSRILWGWEQQLSRWAPCFTANKSHRAYTAFLAEQLAAAGVEPRRQDFPIPLWDPKLWRLSLDGQPIPITGYRPYSGRTGPEGLTAKIVHVGEAAKPDWSGAAGAIGLIDTPAPGVIGEQGGMINASRPLYTVRVADLDAAKAAGVAACVYIWRGISDADAQDQILPFNAKPGEVPALWVGAAAGDRLKSAAAARASATLTLHAEIDPHAAGENVWGVLPGMTDEVILLNTHTDGCNACEENGGLAIVALAQALAKIPKAERRKTYVFLMTTGHFAHGFHRGSTAWMKANADILARTVACLTVEHLGAEEWTDDGRAYQPTGRFQAAAAYTPNASMQALFVAARTDGGVQRMQDFAGSVYFGGEGSQFARAGVPSIAYITAPDYLMTAPKGGEVARLNQARMYDEVRTFARCLERLDAVTREAAYAGMAEVAQRPPPAGFRPGPSQPALPPAPKS